MVAQSNLQLNLTAPNGTNISIKSGLFINNEFVPSMGNGPKLSPLDPSTGSKICSIESANEADVDLAVRAARAAFENPQWSELSGTERGKIVTRLADLMEQEEHALNLSTLETWNAGKVYSSVHGMELPAAIDCLRYYAGWADKLHGQTIPTHSKKFAYTLKQPVGVCGQIIPWNYPLLMAAWKLGPALATGNTIVLKPAEQTPLSLLYLSELIVRAGFPPGVVNIVNGPGRVGGAITAHPGVDKIAFTGSTNTGRLVQKTASDTMKRVTLETGGKSALVVFNDADIEQAAQWAHRGIMTNQGQICTSNSRLLVQRGVYEKFNARLAEVVQSFKVGNPFDKDTFQGPQISKQQLDKILSYATSAKEEGAKLVTGGSASSDQGNGFFMQPTIFSDVRPDMKTYREEIFGPFVAVTPFETEEEAIRMANETDFGLAGSVFTSDIQRAHRVSSKLQAGMVWINSSTDSDFRVPFGGVKQSGIGSELGEAGLEEYLQIKAVHVNLGLML